MLAPNLVLAPGPTQVPERVRLAMAKTLLHHRTPQFKELFLDAQAGLKWVFGTEHPVLMLSCSGTGGFEAAMTNFTKRGDTIVCVGGGKFGERWALMGRAWGLNVVDYDLEWGQRADPEVLASLLDATPNVTMVTWCASETSTGVYHPVQEMAQVIRDHSDALIAVDGITAVGVHPLPMDQWGIDIVVSGSQKAFSIPPGLAFVAAGPRAWEREKSSDHPRFYFDLESERKKQAEGQTAYTSSISLVVGLAEALQMMREEGLDAIHARHLLHSRATRAALEAAGLELFTPFPSHCVSAALLPQGISAPQVCKSIRDEFGVTIAGGQDHLKPRLIRVGHLGFITRHDVLAALGALELALTKAGHRVTPGSAIAGAQGVYMEHEGL